MKRLALVLALLLPSFTHADTMLPDGCYVAFSNPGYCFTIPNGETLVWTQSTDQNTLAPSYGQIVAVILSVAQTRKIDLAQCLDDYNGLTTQFNDRTNQYNSLVTQYNSRGTQISGLNASLNVQKKLVTKLRKKCGKPCKKIK